MVECNVMNIVVVLFQFLLLLLLWTLSIRDYGHQFWYHEVDLIEKENKKSDQQHQQPWNGKQKTIGNFLP